MFLFRVLAFYTFSLFIVHAFNVIQTLMTMFRLGLGVWIRGCFIVWKIREKEVTCFEIFWGKRFVKTVLIGEEINFSVHAGFFVFSIRIQRYKERKFLGGGLKVMIVSSTKSHGQCPVVRNGACTIFVVYFLTFSMRILKYFLNEKCAFACLLSFTKIWLTLVNLFERYALTNRHRSISKVISFWIFVLHVEMLLLCALRAVIYALFNEFKLTFCHLE